MLERISAVADSLDVGYQVFLDKDNRTSQWKLPSYMAHVPGRPTEAEYLSLIGEFWWEATYVARSLWREGPVFAKFCLDYQIKLDVMRRMLEWRMEIEHDWRIRPGVHGRNLNRLLPADIWEQWSRLMSVRKGGRELGRAVSHHRAVSMCRKGSGRRARIRVPGTIERWGGGLPERGETFLL